MNLKAVLFDLYGTLAYTENPISSKELSEFLLTKGYEVYPQALDAASHYVSMIDYPKYGYSSWEAYLQQVFHRLDMKIESRMLDELAEVYRNRRSLTLFQEVAFSIMKIKTLGLKTAIVTTIAHFCFASAIEPIRESLDFIMTGYEAGCEKSNPLMHRKVLKQLEVRPHEAVMVGDDPLVDIRIPKRIGMYTIFLDRGRKTYTKLGEADAKVNTLTEATSLIEKWIKD